MEPVEWVIGLILLFGGYEVFGKDKKDEPVEVVQDVSIVSEDPVFERGRFFKTPDGYYISDLSPKPEQIEGCESPLLTADLTKLRDQEDAIEVTEIDVSCEG